MLSKFIDQMWTVCKTYLLKAFPIAFYVTFRVAECSYHKTSVMPQSGHKFLPLNLCFIFDVLPVSFNFFWMTCLFFSFFLWFYLSEHKLTKLVKVSKPYPKQVKYNSNLCLVYENVVII